MGAGEPTADCFREEVAVHGFEEKIDGSRFHDSGAHAYVRIGAQEDGLLGAARQCSLEVGAMEVGKGDACHEATGAVVARVIEKFFAGGEGEHGDFGGPKDLAELFTHHPFALNHASQWVGKLGRGRCVKVGEWTNHDA